MTAIPGTPFEVLSEKEDWGRHAGRIDALVVVIGARSVELPQFDVTAAVDGDSNEAREDAIERALREMLAFYQALSELPQEYINEVERYQLDIFTNVIGPWVMRSVARDPGAFHLSPLTADLVGA